jgi:hypothetical protein
MASCALLRDLMRATTLEKTVDGKLILPLPGMKEEVVQLIMNIIHGVHSVMVLDLDDVLTALNAMKYLQCTIMDDLLMDRLWDVVSTQSLSIFKKHCGLLIRCPRHATRTMNELIRRMPLWRDFKIFLEDDDVRMDADVSVVVATSMVKFFPPATALSTIVDLLPRASMSPGILLKLAGLPGAGVYFHPRETVNLVRMLVSYFGSKKWDTYTGIESCFRTLMDAYRRYEAVPHQASVVNGSVFMYDGTPTSSVLLSIDRRLGKPKTVRVCPWLRVVISPSTGHVQLWLRPHKMDEMARGAHNFQIRLTAGQSLEMENVDVWYEWHNVNVTSHTILSVGTVNRSTGSHDAFHEAMRSSSLKTLRFDVFYGPVSVLDNPLDV